MKRPTVSSHYSFDVDPSQWQFFSRWSRLPHGYFDRRTISPHALAVAITVGGLILALTMGWGGR